MDNIGYDIQWLKTNHLDIYNWDILCFNGFIEDELLDNDFIDASSSKVRFPNERINDNTIDTSINIKLWNNNGTWQPIKFDSSSSKYMTSWNGSDNYIDQGTLKTNILYCDISLDTEENCIDYFNQYYYSESNSESYNNFILNWIKSNKAKRKTYIYRNNELVDIDTLFTDCTECIRQTLSDNNGNMKLKENRMYFCKNFDLDGLFDISEYSNFVIDGQNSIIFCHSSISGMPCYTSKYNNKYLNSYIDIPVFKAYNSQTKKSSNNFIIRNLSIVSLHDKDNGCKASSSDMRMSSSSSLLTAFLLGGKNIDIYNIKIQNLKSAVNIENNNFIENNIRLSNITAYSIEDNNINGIYVYLNQCVFSQKIFIGSNNSLICHSNTADRIFITNSVFICFDNYCPSIISISDNLSNIFEYNTHIYYTDCSFSGGVIFDGSYNVNGKQFIHFINSSLIQLNNLYYYNNSLKSIPYILNIKTNSVELNKCYIEANLSLSEYFISASGNTTQLYIITSNNFNTNNYTNNRILNTSLNGSQLISYDNSTSPTGWNKINCPSLFHQYWNEYKSNTNVANGASNTNTIDNERNQAVVINQPDSVVYLNMSTDPINCTYNGGTFFKEISSNFDWTITYDSNQSSWLTISKVSNGINISVHKNEIPQEYSCKVIITSTKKSALSKEFYIILEAAPNNEQQEQQEEQEEYVLAANPMELSFNFDSTEEDPLYIEVTASEEWNISNILCDWATITKEDSTSIKVIASENDTDEEKSGTFKIQLTNHPEIEIEISLTLWAELYQGASLQPSSNNSNQIPQRIPDQYTTSVIYDGNMNAISATANYTEISGLNSTYPVNAPNYFIDSFPKYWLDYNVCCFNGFLNYDEYDFTESSYDANSNIYKYYNDVNDDNILSMNELVLKIYDNDVNDNLLNVLNELVFYPQENIWLENITGINHNLYTAKDIYYDNDHNRFVLKKHNSNNEYYVLWNRSTNPDYQFNHDSAFINKKLLYSSNLYNSAQNKTAKLTSNSYNLYSDISLDSNGKHKRNTYILKQNSNSNKNEFVNIWDEYEDATEYIYNTLKRTGNLTLEEDKVYVMSPKKYNIQSEENPLYNRENILINGNGAYLFVMLPKNVNNNLNSDLTFYNDIHYLFNAYNTKNLTIKNLNICCICDKDIHSIKNYKLLSTSNSGVGFLYVDGNSSNINISKVNTYNCNTFHFNSGTNITIDEWISKNESHIYLNGTSVYITNSKVSQKLITGTGMNLIYGSPYLLHCENCKFQVNSPFTPALMNMSLSSNSKCIRFINCDFNGYVALEKGYPNIMTNNGMQWLIYHNCTFNQIFHSYIYGKDNNHYLGIADNPYVFQAMNTSQIVYNCNFYLDTLSLTIFNEIYDKNCYCFVNNSNIYFVNSTYQSDSNTYDNYDDFVNFVEESSNYWYVYRIPRGQFIYQSRTNMNPNNIGQPTYRLNPNIYVPLMIGNSAFSESLNPDGKQYSSGNIVNGISGDFSSNSKLVEGDLLNTNEEINGNLFLFIKELLEKNNKYSSSLISLIIYYKQDENNILGQYYYIQPQTSKLNLSQYKYNYLNNKIDINTRVIYNNIDEMKSKIYVRPIQNNLFFTYLYCDINNNMNTFIPEVQINPKYSINVETNEVDGKTQKTTYVSSYFTLNYINNIIDKNMFKNNGVVLSTKHNIDSFSYSIPDYKFTIVNNIVEKQYKDINYTIHLNNQNKPNIKLLYDFRNIQKLTYNLANLDYNNYDYFFFSLDLYFLLLEKGYITDDIFSMLKENHLIYNINSRKILLGYVSERINKTTYRKKFYPLYNDIGTNFISDLTSITIENFNHYMHNVDLNDLIYEYDSNGNESNYIINYKYKNTYNQTRLFIYELKEIYKIGDTYYDNKGKLLPIADLSLPNNFNTLPNGKYYIFNQNYCDSSNHNSLPYIII